LRCFSECFSVQLGDAYRNPPFVSVPLNREATVKVGGLCHCLYCSRSSNSASSSFPSRPLIMWSYKSLAIVRSVLLFAMVGFLSLVSLLRHLRHWCAIEIRLMAQLLGSLAVVYP
jgi:hypothetical protein